MKHIAHRVRFWVLILLLLGAAGWSSLSSYADDWPGFRGGAKQGYAAGATAPLHWSTNQNIVWKTRIPGQGHSSPIVAGDSVYVTTSYASPQHQVLRRYCRWAVAALAGLLVIQTLWRFISNRRRTPEVFRRIALMSLLAVAATVVVWWGPDRLGLETHDVRAWQASMAILLSCLGIAGMVFPFNSRAWLAVGMASVLSIVPAYFLFPDRDELWTLDSLSSVVSLALLGCLLIGGAIAWAGHFGVRRRFRTGVSAEAGLGGWLAVGLALLTAGLYGYDANHLRRTKSLVRAVVCLDAKSGQVRWSREGLQGKQRPLTAMNTAATPTPVTDGERVLAWFASAGLMCVSRVGDLLWTSRELVSDPKYGTASSPVLHEGVAVLVSDVEQDATEDRQSRSWIAGVELRTGQVLWRVARPSHSRFANYATPVIQSTHGTNLVWVYGWHGIDAYELRTGRPMGHYSNELVAHHLAASPAIEDTRLFIPGPKQHRCLDVAKLVAGADPLLWSAPARGEISSSPVVADGLAFLVDESGMASCLEMTTGRKLWEKRLPKRYFASVTAVGERVYFCNELGRTTVIERSPTLKELGGNDLYEKVYPSFGVAGNRLYIRGTDHLFCVAEGKIGDGRSEIR